MRMLGTHHLLHPITVDTKDAQTGELKEQELKSAGFCVTLRRPKAKDLRVFDEHGTHEIAATLALIARISNLDTLEVDNLDGADLDAVGNLLGNFVPSGPKTGATSSGT